MMFLDATYTVDMEMSEYYSIPMALVDLIPVILFFLAGAILIKDMYNKLVKGNYALLATGIIMVFMAGCLKALWKMLVAAGACDWVALNTLFFPMQAIGFMCYGFALVGIFYSKKLWEEGNVKVQGTALLTILSIGLMVLSEVQPFTSNMPFVVIQIIGDSLALVMLMIMAIKMQGISKNMRILIVALIAVSFVFMLGMGYLSTKSNKQNPVALINWCAEIVNTISQGALFAGVFLMHKNGLDKMDIFVKEKAE